MADAVKCDICGRRAEKLGNGGAVMKEHDGTWTLVCEECYINFCALDDAKRRERYGDAIMTPTSLDDSKNESAFVDAHRAAAIYMGVGTDADVVANAKKFSTEIPLTHHHLAHVALQLALRYGIPSMGIVSVPKTAVVAVDGKKLPENTIAMHAGKIEMDPKYHRTDDGGPKDNKHCWNPDCTHQRQQLSRCSRCRVAWYCSVECQRAHFALHKSLCAYANLYVELVLSQLLNVGGPIIELQ